MVLVWERLFQMQLALMKNTLPSPSDTQVYKGQSVARRMSWAERREAIRLEDIAYSLLGIFDVRMPLLQDEGQQKAFRKL
jgi:hypothetical protein